jgi:hypothetical protein
MGQPVYRRQQSGVLVTGANGVVGRVLRARLNRDGILFTDRDTVDVSRAAGLVGCFRGAGAVVHLASPFREGRIDAARAALAVRFARQVVSAALAAGVARVVLCSSVRAAPLPEPWRGREADLAWPPLVIRASHAIERTGAAAAARGLDVITLRLGGVAWPDWPGRGLEGLVWLSHEDCASLMGRCLDVPVERFRHVIFTATSDLPGRVHDTANSIGWSAKTRSLTIARRLRHGSILIKSALRELLGPRREGDGGRFSTLPPTSPESGRRGPAKP